MSTVPTYRESRLLPPTVILAVALYAGCAPEGPEIDHSGDGGAGDTRTHPPDTRAPADANGDGEAAADDGDSIPPDGDERSDSGRKDGSGRDTVGDADDVDVESADAISDTDTTSASGLPSRLTDPAELAFWVRASDAQSSNSTVTEWPDQSGNDLDFVAGSDLARRPAIVPSAIDGRPAVRFDGSSDVLNTRNRSTRYVETRTATVFFVAKNNDADHTGQLLSACAIGNNQLRYDAGPRRLYMYAHNAFRDERLTDLTSATTSWQVLTVVLGSSSLQIYQNGNLSDSTSVTAEAEGNWRFNQIGMRCSESSEALHGDVAEILFYDTQLNGTERQAVESYLSNKFGL